MESKDDPEYRIRELESQLSELAGTSQLGVAATPPTPPPTYGAPFPPTPVRTGLSLWWILLVLLVVGAVMLAAGVAFFSAHIFSMPRSSISSPTSATRAPTSTSPSGAQVSVSGIGESRTIACTNNAVTISGVSDTVVITGHCASLTVTGVNNKVTVDASDTITASGFNNQITYQSGTPTVNNFGGSNVVQQG